MPLVLHDITVAFGPNTVLDHASIEIAPAASVAIMGPSGSGKTTLLSVLAGLRVPDAGTRTCLRDGQEAGPRDVSVAWVFQTSPVLMRRTALDNAALGAACAGIGHEPSRERARTALDQLGIGSLAHRRLYQLSGGERQRVVIARAMSSGAELVIADEPTAALDGDAKDLVCDALASLARSGAGVVVATHDPTVAASCDRLLRLDRGQLTG